MQRPPPMPKPRKVKNASRQQMTERKQDRHPERKRLTSSRPTPPTARMVSFAEKLAKEKSVGLLAGYARDFEICRRFLDQHA